MSLSFPEQVYEFVAIVVAPASPAVGPEHCKDIVSLWTSVWERVCMMVCDRWRVRVGVRAMVCA